MKFIDFSGSPRRTRAMLLAAAGAIALVSGPVQAQLADRAGPALQREAAGFRSQDSARMMRGYRNVAASAVQPGYPRRPSREVSDQEHAKYQRDRGQNKDFDELFSRARSVGRGEYLGVEPDISSNIYRFKFMRPGGKVVWVDMDGRTGRVVAERD